MSSDITYVDTEADESKYLDSATRFARRIIETAGKEQVILKSVCINHHEQSPVCVCASCQLPFCYDCVKSVGIPSAYVCKVCGSNCLPFKDVLEKLKLLLDQRTPFGRSDFKMALAFPFQEPAVFLLLSIVYGATLYTVPFLWSSSPIVLWGVLGFLPAFVSTSVLLGCASKIIDRVEQGRTDSKGLLDTVSLLATVPDIAVRGLALLASLLWPAILAASLKWPADITACVSVIWAILYYPLALGVVTLKQSPWSAINPLAGLRVLIQMGSNSAGFMARYARVAIVAGGLLSILKIKIAPEGFNLIASVFFAVPLGLVVSYASAITAFLLGRALFKAESIQ
ncbi:MAG TPA: hypothetical protein VFC63_08265 [Blastocatellia bacterium]|nr:hypothetical protein [Blastocatellia bacterium]